VDQRRGVGQDHYRDLQQSQPDHIEIMGEKNTVAGIIEPVAQVLALGPTWLGSARGSVLTARRRACAGSPVSPELRPYLEEAFELAADGSVFLIARYRDCNQNLRTQFQRIIRRAALESWPKLLHNLRATRETELAELHPIHVVCAWVGHAAAIAQKQYLQVRDEDFERAAADPSGAKPGALCAKTAQNPAQHWARTEHENPGESGGFFEEPAFSADDECPERNTPRTGWQKYAREIQR
jgi:hypothetical protein